VADNPASGRTVIVATRLSADELHVTYCNALDAPRPYVITLKLHGAPFDPIGLSAEQLPDVGETRYVVSDS
jgi:hypothetical protein